MQQAVLQMPGRCCGVLKTAAAMNLTCQFLFGRPPAAWRAIQSRAPVASGPAFRSAAHGYSCIVVRAGPDAANPKSKNAASEDRTHDLRIMRPTRCQLRYRRPCHVQLPACRLCLWVPGVAPLRRHASSASFLVFPLLICLFPGLPHLHLSWSSSSSDSFLVFPPHTLKSREAEPSEPASGKAGGEPTTTTTTM